MAPRFAPTATICPPAAVLLEHQHDLVQPGYFFDLEGGPYLVVSLLTKPDTFAEGLRRLNTQ